MLIADFLRPPKLSDRRNFVKAMRRWMIVDFDKRGAVKQGKSSIKQFNSVANIIFIRSHLFLSNY
jgi:hypothetical protein